MKGNFARLCLCTRGTEMQQEIPAEHSFTHPLKKGLLFKLTGKGWFSSGCWRLHRCILDGTKFYYYGGEESKGTDKSSGVISLDYFDLCEKAAAIDKKKPYLFTVGSSVRGFFDNRHQFAAETEVEVQEWVQAVHSVITEARNRRSRAGRNRNGGNGKWSPDLGKSENYSPKMSEDSAEEDSVKTEGRLVIPTKDRAKGPQGRRLPQRKSMMPTSSMSEASDLRQRSISLSSPKEGNENEDQDTHLQSTRLSVSMETVEGQTSEERMDNQRSSSTYDIPFRHQSTSQGEVRTAEPIKPKKVPKFAMMGGQHAALTKELESKLKLGLGPGGRRPLAEESDPETGRDELEKKIDSLDTKLDSVRSDVSELENKIAELSNTAEHSTDKYRDLQLQIQDILNQAVSALKDVESTNTQCKQALAEAEKTRDEQQRLLRMNHLAFYV